MKILILVLILCSLSFNVYANPLKEYRWDNRLIIYSVAEADSDKYNIQKIVSDNQDKIIDRDLIFIDLNQKDKGEYFIEVSADDITELIEAYNIKADQSVFILVGKDGGEKERLLDKFNIEYFFDKIDQMPMRIDEMNRL